MIYVLGEVMEDGTASPYVKVGFVAGGPDTFLWRVEKRVNQLQVGNPRRLVLIASCVGEREREKEIHRMFPDVRVRRPHVTEWMRLEGAFGAFVDSMRLSSPRTFGRAEPKPPKERVVVGRPGPRQKHPCSICGSTDHTMSMCPNYASMRRAVARAADPKPIAVLRREVRGAGSRKSWTWRGKERPHLNK